MNTSLDPGPICLDANHPCVLPTVFFFFLPSPLKKKKQKKNLFFAILLILFERTCNNFQLIDITDLRAMPKRLPTNPSIRQSTANS